MFWGIILKAAGIASFLLLIITAATGVYLRKLKLKIAHHKALAITAVAAAIVHTFVVFLFQYIL